MTPPLTKGPRIAKIVAAAISAGLVCAGCTPREHTIEPYRSNPSAAKAIAQSAEQACPRAATDRPTHSFTTDGCSAFPDDGWVDCCVEHDFEYWCGGSAVDRSRADARLRQCVAEKKTPALGWLMWLGVRAGGVPWSPFPWRWAYGWDCCRGYDERGQAARAP
jgi:hypothetical protein